MRKPCLVSLVCVNCGITFTRNKHWVQNPDKTICTRYCNGTVPTPLGPSTKIAILTCSNPKCGSLFVRKAKDVQRDLDHTFCSKKCAGRPPGNSAGVQIAYFNCEQCGKLFIRRPKHVTKGAAHVVCSNECRDNLRRQRPETVPCDQCGAIVKTNAANYHRTLWHFCSIECRDAVNWRDRPPKDITPEQHARREKDLIVVRANSKRRRARLRAVTINDFTGQQWEEMKAIHKGRCVYCPPDCKACRNKTHKLTQDHLTPLGPEGPHTKQNILPACHRCNSKKNKYAVLKPVQPLLL